MLTPRLTVAMGFLLLIASTTQAQFRFTNTNSKLINPAFHSGCPMTVADWNNDGLDDIIRLDQGRNASIEVQRTDNTFQTITIGSFSTSNGWAWGMAVADLDKNGFLDIIAGGSSSALRIFMTGPSGVLGTMVSIPNTGFFVQNLTCGDINNDGWIDLFACDDNAESHIFLNNGAGTLVESATTINFDVTSTDDSGNYGSTWTDFDNDGDLDLHIAKCRQGVNSPTDGRRINVMFVNNGNGTFTENAAAYGLNIGWQSWTASFGDIDNDGDLDLLVTNHDYQSQILENDGTGHYTDITASTGFNITDITPIQSVMEDFDNDGFIDLLIAGSDHRIYRNNGNKTFTRIEGMFNSNEMESFAIGDLNHDGKMDIYGGYANIYTNPSTVDDVIWMNTVSNNNHFVNLDLEGTVSNKDAIGARALVYGAWGVQVREVRSGESYGTVNSFILHFGLGQNNYIDSIVVRFPSGITQTLVSPPVDQFIRIIESDCVSPNAFISYSNLAPYICTGATETLSAPTGLNYLWNTTETTESITIQAGGEYNALVSQTGNNCSTLTPTVIVQQDPDQTPSISTVGDLEFCDGGSVQLNASADGNVSFAWSNGASGASTSIGLSGQYTVTALGYCSTFTSSPVTVTSHVIPDPITTPFVVLQSPGSATLTASGSILNWYDAATSTTPLYTGSSFTTPFIASSEDFWVENSENYNGGLYATGQPYHGGSSQYSGTNSLNAYTTFNVAKPCVLRSVKVYTDRAGTRRFTLRDSQGNLLQFVDVLVSPDTQVVNLNFTLSPGNGYRLGTLDSMNLLIANWNNAGPRFRRTSNNNVPLPYPYVVNNGLSITGNSSGTSFYFYYYDWNVDVIGLNCYSQRLQVIASVATGVSQVIENRLIVYPNPAHDQVNVLNPFNDDAIVRVSDASGRVLDQKNIATGAGTIDVSQYSKGTYFIEIRQGENLMHNKIVVN
jgi:hypothetical protein